MSNTKPILAFFGATGGCAGTCLANALREGYTCTALVRMPQKLRDLLINHHQIPESTITSNLHIHTGNAKDPLAVAKALVSPQDPSRLIDKIMFGVGAAPKLAFSMHLFTLDDPNVCEESMKAIFSALELLANRGFTKCQSSDGKPVLVMVSTTGLSTKARDVPLLMVPLYHMLDVPHQDKHKTEELLFNDKGAHLGDYVIVRATLLVDGEGKGPEAVRAGWEWGVGREKVDEKEPGPQLGYSISRRDVGEWVFREVMAAGEEETRGWGGKCVSLTC